MDIGIITGLIIAIIGIVIGIFVARHYANRQGDQLENIAVKLKDIEKNTFRRFLEKNMA
jgi:positive regulator of sigma E activity